MVSTVKKHKQNDVIMMGQGEPLWTAWSWKASLRRWPWVEPQEARSQLHEDMRKNVLGKWSGWTE